jgi:hypothetical protein
MYGRQYTRWPRGRAIGNCEIYGKGEVFRPKRGSVPAEKRLHVCSRDNERDQL